MDFNLRDWLLILGPVFISVVLIHGYWRMRRGQGELKMKLDKSFLSAPGEDPSLDELSLLKAELPNGGARIASPHVPVLMEPVEIDVVDPVMAEAKKAPLAKAKQEKAETMESERVETDPEKASPVIEKAPPVRKLQATKPEKFVVINVLADTSFNGQALLETLLELDMTFGKMEIFHRLDEAGETQFSLANAVEPGSFHPGTMDELQTPGVTLFMHAHEVHDPLRVYDGMLEAAQTLALELGGELRDESRSVITTQTIDYCRQGIQDFQYKHPA
ncbi:MAG: cell division protein ZipA [Gammaproteobacteria bacterium]|nr:cell division protein ZipA [Gammaproteobacteria bacterium]